MILKALRLRDFRNLRRIQIEPHSRFNILTGKNGQGKSNLLEAIYLLSAVKSYRGQATNRNLIYFDAEQAVLEALIERGGHERQVKIEISERGKKVYLNDVGLRNIADFFGTLNVVIFGPEDIGILKGSPSARRQFIDRAIFNAHPAYATESAHFEEVLKNRNALLKEPAVDPALLSVYDDQFLEWGAQILRRRFDFLINFQPFLEEIFQEIFHETFQARLTYEPSWAQHSLAMEELIKHDGSLEALLRSALDQTQTEERQRGFTLIGPHRDDLIATLNGQDVRAFASQGQTRAFILAMKISEIVYLEERYHFAPILLLDDVSSELDRERNRFLFDFLKKRGEGQVFITTTHRDHILLDQDLKHFSVDAGQIREVYDA